MSEEKCSPLVEHMVLPSTDDQQPPAWQHQGWSGQQNYGFIPEEDIVDVHDDPRYPKEYDSSRYYSSQPHMQQQVVRQQHVFNATVLPDGSGDVEILRRDNTNNIILSCFAFWCCCWILGAVSFFFALTARDKLDLGNVDGARSSSRTSRLLSVVAIAVGSAMIVLAIVLIVVFGVMGLHK